MDLTGWLEYFVEGLATQMDEITERGDRTRIISARLMDRKEKKIYEEG